MMAGAWRAERQVAERVAIIAGEAMLTHYGKLDAAQVGFKGLRDLVTAADLASERIVVEALRREFPEHHVLAEEEFSQGVAARGGQAAHADPANRPADTCRDPALMESAIADRRYCWIVDPLDGTTNFAHGHPFFAVSIALVVDGQPVLGVVHAPLLRECFVAVVGEGAMLNGRPIRVSDVDSIGDAIFATGFPYRRHEMSDVDNNITHFDRFIREVRGFRRCGSAAIDLCYVAAGRYGFYFEQQLEPWDVAAGALIVREAGGQVSDYSGGDRWLAGRQILASNGRLHERCRARLSR